MNEYNLINMYLNAINKIIVNTLLTHQIDATIVLLENYLHLAISNYFMGYYSIAKYFVGLALPYSVKIGKRSSTAISKIEERLIDYFHIINCIVDINKDQSSILDIEIKLNKRSDSLTYDDAVLLSLIKYTQCQSYINEVTVSDLKQVIYFQI